MTAAAELRTSDGFRVETPRGRLGVVEEVWLGKSGEPEALAVRTVEGRHALVLVEEIEAVLPAEEQVVVDEPTLLELQAPRLDSDRADGQAARLSASWSTTGEVLPLPDRSTGLHLPFSSAPLDVPAPRAVAEGPLWRTVAILYGVIALIALIMMALAFVIPLLVVGHAY